MSRATNIDTYLSINIGTPTPARARARTHARKHAHTRHTKVPLLEEATKEHREALQQELARVIQTANSDSSLYVAVAADTHPEVATCEKAIEDMLAHEQKVKEDEVRRQREEIQERTYKLLAKLRATREKVRMCACMT